MFNPRNQKPNDHIPILDPVTTSDYSYNLRNWPKNDVESVQFRVQESSNHVDYGDESGVSSPPLWKNSHQISTNYRSHSNSSRALAIARGQFELMEMVKNMPESCYELSLKDLVEQNRVLESDQEECLINKEEENFTSTTSLEQQRMKSIQRQESNSSKKSNNNKNDHQKKGKMIRSESFENQRLFLKMFFPISLESKKKNLKNSPKTSTKVSPKPEGSVKSSKNVEKDWWKRRFSCSSESDSSRTGSSNSESTDTSGSSGSNGSRKSKYRYIQFMNFSI
ncbi:hypothetical protein A4A49_43608 [Nicotiana attenuata]|uniref:Uncharacterized protein n=1 Tax=Nicotiana attenuata TaxID=49451 RepID=A0A1J6JN97_NICAT|nr:hypothetical protein A4A49_43608 [Nicotiana attenuata]